MVSRSRPRPDVGQNGHMARNATEAETSPAATATGARSTPTNRWARTRLWLRKRRYIIRSNPSLNFCYRCTVGVIGTLVLIVGIIAIPYPGPGWLIVFLALGILASEFGWARRILHLARGKYDQWMAWVKRSHWSIQAAMGLGTVLIVVATLWLVNAFGMMAGWVGIDADWLRGPLAGFA